MAKSANINVRIDPETKKRAEDLFSSFGITITDAINIFLRKSIMEGGLPFDVRLPEHPLDASRMTTEQLDAVLEKGYAQLQAGQCIPAKQAFDEIRGEVGA